MLREKHHTPTLSVAQHCLLLSSLDQDLQSSNAKIVSMDHYIALKHCVNLMILGVYSHPPLQGQNHILLTYLRFLKSFRQSMSQMYW